MGWLKRSPKPSSGPSLHHTASMGTYSKFKAAYRPSDAKRPDGRRALELALSHAEPDVRVAIASRLLDDGASPAAKHEDGTTTLHALLGDKTSLVGEGE